MRFAKSKSHTLQSKELLYHKALFRASTRGLRWAFFLGGGTRLPRYEPRKVALRSVIVGGAPKQSKSQPLQCKELLYYKALFRASTRGLCNTKASNLAIEGFCFV